MSIFRLGLSSSSNSVVESLYPVNFVLRFLNEILGADSKLGAVAHQQLLLGLVFVGVGCD